MGLDETLHGGGAYPKSPEERGEAEAGIALANWRRSDRAAAPALPPPPPLPPKPTPPLVEAEARAPAVSAAAALSSSEGEAAAETPEPASVPGAEVVCSDLRRHLSTSSSAAAVAMPETACEVDPPISSSAATAVALMTLDATVAARPATEPFDEVPLVQIESPSVPDLFEL